MVELRVVLKMGINRVQLLLHYNDDNKGESESQVNSLPNKDRNAAVI